MLKIRLQGLPHEIEAFINDFHEKYEVLSISDPYENRNSKFVRVYIEIQAPRGNRYE
ncbi:DUF3970 family protein [Priestia aryabhattai]|uniref:DUF3970 family protein n=1 Tax=Priestia aryabhattai TaxID=412384 RepID=UPI00159B9947|nr:DUF3970 family protein [Priestia aryabhattai]